MIQPGSNAVEIRSKIHPTFHKEAKVRVKRAVREIVVFHKASCMVKEGNDGVFCVANNEDVLSF